MGMFKVKIEQDIQDILNFLRADLECTGVEVGFIRKILSILFRTIVLDNFIFYTILPIG